MRTPSASERTAIAAEIVDLGELTSRPQSTSLAASDAGMPLVQRIFSFPAMLAALLIGGVFAIERGFHVDPDLWWHIKVGDSILTTHHWPTTDTYSFTIAGQPWLAYEWVGEVLLAIVNRLGGIYALEVLLIVLGCAVMLSIYGLATICSGNSKAGFVAASILLPLASVSFTLRPQMLGYFFLILTLMALERFRQGRRAALGFLPLLMVIWVNTHGSWIIGLVAILIYWITGFGQFEIGSLKGNKSTPQDQIYISTVFLLCVAALPITPYGARIAASPFEFALSLPLNTRYIQEWQSMPFNLAVGKVFLALLLAVIVVQIIYGVTWRLEYLLLFLLATVMACIHVRFLLVFVPSFVQSLATTLAKWIPRYDPAKDKPALNALLIACVVIGVVRYFPSSSRLRQDIASQFPVAAVEYLEKHPLAGRMYNNYSFGGYLIWSMGPQHKVFLDGRGDAYERGGVLADYLHVSGLQPGALKVLDLYGVQSCLLLRDEPLSTALSVSPDWRRIYFDNVSALFVRTRSGIALP